MAHTAPVYFLCMQNDIHSPFSAAHSHPIMPPGRRKRSAPYLLIGIGLVLLITAAIGSIDLFDYMSDPYRKLQEFPISRYFESYQSLAGLKFRSDLRVEADLGWKDGVGRLMVFTPVGDTHQLAAFIPPSLTDVFFNKGQNYTASLEVKEGGLIYVDSCRKD